MLIVRCDCSGTFQTPHLLVHVNRLVSDFFMQPQSETRMTASVLQQLGDALCTVEPLLTPSPHRRLPLFGGLFFSHVNSFFFSSTISHVPAWHGKNRMLLFSCLLKMSDFLMAKYIHIYMDVHKIEIYICLRVCVCVFIFKHCNSITKTAQQPQNFIHKNVFMFKYTFSS